NGPLVEGPVAEVAPAGLPEAIRAYNARHDLGLDTHASAEAQIAALSDDIAYVNHDLADGLRAGLFTEEEAAALPRVGTCYAMVDQRWPGLEAKRRRHEALRRVFGLMVDDALAETGRRLAVLAPASADAIREAGHPVAAFSEPMMDDIRTIKSFLFRRMYRHYRVRRMRIKATRVVRELFDIFLSDPGLMPDHWMEVARAAPDEHARARVVADYIAGMTDRFALEEHRVLTDPAALA
ncbi:MAG: deoxyguanosinetriphosphate triphosphohydrolase, partial [Pseudomonadota bacterium]